MADRAVLRARALLGVPFRLHGRDPDHGLDCVGLMLAVYSDLADIPPGYGLRGGDAARFAALLGARGLVQRKGAPDVGDILLLKAAAAQFHLGLWSGTGLIHADAMLRRVVETPGLPRWPLIGAWHWPRPGVSTALAD